MNSKKPIKFVFACSEVAGFAKTGGLADVGAGLPAALLERGHEGIIVMPLYRCIRTGKHVPEPTPMMVQVPIRNYVVRGTIWKTHLPDCEMPVYMIANPDYFERDDPQQGKTLYQFTNEEGSLQDYPDNAERFAFFSRAVLELLRLLEFWPDILHGNDWHTGLIPVYLKEIYCRHFTPAFRPFYQGISTLHTIHNIAYQGIFPDQQMDVVGLPWSLFNHHQLEYYGKLNFLKAGLVFADQLSTVSPTYATEIQSPAYGCGLQGVLFQRREDLQGIINGVDYKVWSPSRDSWIAEKYGIDSVIEGKSICKRRLQEAVGLPVEGGTPLIAVISRLVAQKGFDLLVGGIQELLQQDVQMVILGNGEKVYQEFFTDLAAKHPNRMVLLSSQDDRFAHQLEAGADIFLRPSLFEPCGLNQLYSLKYGTVPVVRKTGGLADTVVDSTPEAISAGLATGFVFELPTPLAMLGALERALICYRTQRTKWLEIIRAGMRQDWSWQKSAEQYELLYDKMMTRSKTS